MGPRLALCGLLLLGAGERLAAEAAPAEEGAEPVVEVPQRQLHRYPLAEGVDVVGERQYATAEQADTLLDIAARHAVGYEEIRRANPDVDTWLPGAGAQVTVPTRFILPETPREGIVVNIAEMRLYRYPEGKAVVETFPVSVGRRDWSTPLGKTRVTEKITDPVWYPPDSIREEAEARGEALPAKVPPGPDNPLGHYALLLDLDGYLLHSTNRPWGIGMRATHGCIRLHPQDMAYLFDRIQRGTPVRIVNQPFKAGWSRQGELFLQAFPAFGGRGAQSRDQRLEMAVDVVEEALGDRQHRIDGQALRAAVQDPRGKVRSISRGAPEGPLQLTGP
ncbi:hypothetical protein CKO13_03470 [Halorhodospira neutriphila]|uniref:L,D-TPase catalytic domain-containing protein n=1 Tax=Halorhodospira neutriphila TaxID=168379 RepID=A0ABS1E3N9_9GAMM|nr:hypothetical protein [Halorhodospira neutriphila]